MANGMSQSDHHAGAPAASKTRKFTQSSKTKLMFSKIFVTLTMLERVLTHDGNVYGNERGWG